MEGVPDKGRSAGLLSGRSLFRNTVFNLSGELATIFVALICVPYVVGKLGTDAFGILSIAWMLLGYISLFDFGLTRATTKFVAELVSTGARQQLPSLVWTSISFQFGFGLLTAVLFASNLNWLAIKILKIPQPLLADATRGFLFLAIALPFALVTNCLRGVLEATQRFDLINYIKVATNVLTFASPLILIPFGAKLSSIILLMMCVRVAAVLAYLQVSLSSIWKPGQRIVLEGQILWRLLRYGGWVTISSVVAPLLVYADRFVIAGLLSVSALAYYTGPADMVNRALVIPASLGSILFPAFSSLRAIGAAEKLEDVYARALKYTTIVVGPLLLLVAAFAREILYVWLGPVFVAKSAAVLQILALAVFFSSLAMFPYALLQGAGRPDVTAVFHALELPLHLGLAWIFISRLGIIGAALAVASRVLIDAGLIFWACDRVQLAPITAVLRKGLPKALLVLTAASVLVFAVASTNARPAYRIAVSGVVLCCYFIAQCSWSLDQRDRRFVVSTVRQFAASLATQVSQRYALADAVKSHEND